MGQKYTIVDKNGRVIREFDTEEERDEWNRRESKKWDDCANAFYDLSKYACKSYGKSSTLDAMFKIGDFVREFFK